MQWLINRRRMMQNKIGPVYDSAVAYLENPTNADGGYINTLVIPTGTMTIEIDFEVLQNSSNIGVYGVLASSNQRLFFDTKQNNNLRFYYGQSAFQKGPYAYVNEHFNIVQTGGNIQISSNRRDTITGSTGGTWRNIGYPICLFRYFNGAPTEIAGYSGLRIYYCKISDGNTLIRDFIPVRVGQVGCLYDKVSKKIFSNNGLGSFTIGNDVTI